MLFGFYWTPVHIYNIRKSLECVERYSDWKYEIKCELCNPETEYIDQVGYVFRKEIEIFEESDDSYFDKYLNEVLYLFENAEADVIVFEDMDRFNANRIFERLREVNTLANIQLQQDNKKILRFFSSLKQCPRYKEE